MLCCSQNVPIRFLTSFRSECKSKDNTPLEENLQVFGSYVMLDSTVSININMISLSVTPVSLSRCSFFIYVNVHFVSELMILTEVPLAASQTKCIFHQEKFHSLIYSFCIVLSFCFNHDIWRNDWGSDKWKGG